MGGRDWSKSAPASSVRVVAVFSSPGAMTLDDVVLPAHAVSKPRIISINDVVDATKNVHWRLFFFIADPSYKQVSGVDGERRPCGFQVPTYLDRKRFRACVQIDGDNGPRMIQATYLGIGGSSSEASKLISPASPITLYCFRSFLSSLVLILSKDNVAF